MDSSRTFLVLLPLNTSNSLPKTPIVHFLSHHSVQHFFLPLSYRPADAEPGPHSKTAGARVSQLINTQNYLPPPNHISFFSNMHTEKQSEREFSIITLLNIHRPRFDKHNVGIVGHQCQGRNEQQNNKSKVKPDEKTSWQIIFILSPSLLVLQDEHRRKWWRWISFACLKEKHL